MFCFVFCYRAFWISRAPEETKMWKRSKVTDQTAAGQAGKCWVMDAPSLVRSVRGWHCSCLHLYFLSSEERWWTASIWLRQLIYIQNKDSCVIVFKKYLQDKKTPEKHTINNLWRYPRHLYYAEGWPFPLRENEAQLLLSSSGAVQIIFMVFQIAALDSTSPMMSRKLNNKGHFLSTRKQKLLFN